MNKIIDVKIRSETHICDYGCGQEAIHQFKNGKWCCSKSFKQCIGVREKQRQSHLGDKNPRFNQKISIITRKRISKSNKGNPPWNKGKTGIYSKETLKKMSLIKKGKPSWNKNKKASDETKKRMSESIKGNIPWNKNLKGCYKLDVINNMKKRRSIQSPPMLNKKHSEKSKQKMSISHKFRISKIKEKYPTFAKVEEMRYEPGKEKEKIIQVHCKNHNCPNSKEQGGWFTPIHNGILSYRILSVENNVYSNYMYCSIKCKNDCILFGKSVNQLIKQDKIRAGHLEDPWYNSSEYLIWRKYIFELDNNKCVYCGQPATVAHHIMPQKTHPELSLDPENGIACCEKCHYKYGHRDSWCTTGKLSTLVCKRIIRIKEIINENGINK